MPIDPVKPNSLSTKTRREATPLLPTVVVASYKGGVWKTSLAVAIAERLAMASLRVLFLTSDSQHDGLFRLGQGRSGVVKAIPYGRGSVTPVGMPGRAVVDVLYRFGPSRLELGTFDIVVVDTPPEIHGGKLPGVFLVVPMDAKDAARSAITMLQETPRNSDIMLVKVRRSDPDVWNSYVMEIMEGVDSGEKRTIKYLTSPIPASRLIENAHCEGRSVWTLPARPKVFAFLSAVDALAETAWKRLEMRDDWPKVQLDDNGDVWIEGWDDQE